MKFKRILSGILAATVAVSSLAVSSFTAYGADAPSDVVTPDSGSWKNTTASNNAKLELVSNFGTGVVISQLAGKTEFYVTFDVTGVDDDTEAFLPIQVKNGATHWNADDSCPLVETPTDGTYTVKYSGDAISDTAIFNYLGVNFKTKSSSGKTDKKVTSVTLKYVTLTDPSKADEPAGDDPEPTDYIFDYRYASNDHTYGKVYRATLKSNYVELLKQHNTTEIVFPEEYDDQGEHGKLPVVWLSFRLGSFSAPDEYVTSVILNSKIYNTGTGPFALAKKLEKVVFKYSGDSFDFKGLGYSGGNSSDSIKEIYLYATDLKSVNTDAFREMNKDLKIYVTNNTVKQKLLDSTSTSTYYQLKDDQVIVMGSKPAEPDPTDYIFDYQYSAGTQVYYASLKADYIELLKEKNTTEIVFPEEYDDQTNGKHPVDTLSFKIGSKSTPDEYVTSITFNSNISSAGNGTFACAKKLEKVVYKYSGDAFKVDRMAYNVLLGNSDSIKEIYLYATGLSSVNIDSFRGMNTDLKIYVTNSAVKQKLLDSTKESTYYQLKDEQVIIMESSDPLDFAELDKAIASAEDIVNNHSEEYSEESLNALKTELDKAKALKTNGSAVQGDVDIAVKTLNARIEGLVTKKVAELKSQLQAKIDELNSVSISKYTPTSYKALTAELNSARSVANNAKATEEELQSALDKLTAAGTVDETGLAETGLKKRASLSKVSDFQKHHNSAITSNRGSYTEDSWTEYQKVLDEYEKVYKAANASDCDATDQQIDKAMSDLDAAAKKLQFAELNEEEYQKAKKAVEDIINAEDSPYTAKSIESVRAIYDYQTGNRYNAAIESHSQAEIDSITQTLNDSISNLVKKGDTTALQPLVDDCAKLVESDYTLDSWKLVEDKLAAAQALLDDPDNAGEEEIATIKDELTKAIEALVVDYSEGEKTSGIGKLMPFGKETTLDSGKADESMAGAVKIRYIFDCAADTDFSEYTTIDVAAVINGTNNYKQFKGNNNQKGAKDLSVTLDLESAIKAGDSYTIKADTYAWNEAADYVYLVTRIEYLDAEGKVLKMFTGGGETAKLDKYKKAIEDAKALVESGEYTEESVAALQTAIDNAQALLDSTDGKPLPSQMEDPAAALDAAIKALVEMPKGDISGTVATHGTDVEVTVTVATADGTEVSEVTSANGEYTLADLEDGDYVITFAAEGYVTRSYTATVAGGSVNIEAELHMVGDINGDGNITTVDVGLANAHAKGTKTLEGYDFDVAEVSGDEILTTVDVGIINSIAKGTK